MAPNASTIYPNVPDTVPVKYSTEKNKATTTLIILSIFPMFFFIVFCLKINNVTILDRDFCH